MNLLENIGLDKRRRIIKIIFYCIIVGVMIGAYAAHNQAIKNKETKTKVVRNE